VAPQGSQMEAGETPSRNLNAEIRWNMLKCSNLGIKND
jgi:hypothetical protein